MQHTLDVSDEMLERVARRFRCLGEPFRLRVVRLLSEGEKSVGELVDELHGGQANVSKHLKLLYDDGILARRKDKTLVVYSIADRKVLKLCRLVCGSVAERNSREAAELEWTKAAEGQPRRKAKVKRGL